MANKSVGTNVHIRCRTKEQAFILCREYGLPVRFAEEYWDVHKENTFYSRITKDTWVYGHIKVIIDSGHSMIDFEDL